MAHDLQRDVDIANDIRASARREADALRSVQAYLEVAEHHERLARVAREMATEVARRHGVLQFKEVEDG